MSDPGYALFDTAIGCCGVAWSEIGIIGVQLPEATAAATGAGLARRFPHARETPPPDTVRQAITNVTALLDGETIDLGGIMLDLTAMPDSYRRIYAIVRTIPAGATLTYGEVATRLGEPGAARLVGQAMGANPCPIIMPCHRVLAAGGDTGGFSAPGGVATKLRLLAIEGAAAARGPFEIAPPAATEPPSLFGAPSRQAPFDTDQATAHLRAADPVLARLIDRVGPLGLQINQRSSLFVTLTEAIIHQQLTTKAATTIFGRVKALFPRNLDGPTPEQILRAPDDRLRGAGLSQAKLLALRDLADRARSGAIPSLVEMRDMNEEEIVERLVAVRGIGRWTAEMLLIFRLGRRDVLPADDYGLRKGYALTYRTPVPTARELIVAGEAWRPFRTAACWYLWRARELPAE